LVQLARALLIPQRCGASEIEQLQTPARLGNGSVLGEASVAGRESAQFQMRRNPA